MKNIFYKSVALLLIACGPTQNQSEESKHAEVTYTSPAHHSERLTKLFDAHGGYEQWSKMKSLSYVKGDESTITNLQNRKIRLESPKQVIGFDGSEVWVTPDTVDASRARFYHNLYFYFYTMPFVVGDSGALYEDVEPRALAGKTYHGIKISYGEGVGDAPDDNYILWVDPKTNKMEWLMYTVTYSSGKPSNDYHLIRYATWQEINGLILPTSLQWFQYDGENVGDPRGEATLFEDIRVSDEAPNDSLFAKPTGAQIAKK